MKKLLVALVATLVAQGALAAKTTEELVAFMAKVPTRGTVEPARLERAAGWEWDHEVRVYLPPSYGLTDKSYPTLWVTDNNLEIAQAALSGDSLGLRVEMIVVAVGAPADVSGLEFQRRRAYDFIPDKSRMSPGFAVYEDGAIGGAEGFRDFLVNQLRPELSKQYRMDPKGHTYAGHSGGAQFGLFVLFNYPESFAKYIISSPAAYEPWLDMEEQWHERNEDLPAEVFISAGEAEMSDPFWASNQIMSTVALVTERLALRNYPSLILHSRIFPKDDHLTVLPAAYTWGIEQLWVK